LPKRYKHAITGVVLENTFMFGTNKDKVDTNKALIIHVNLFLNIVGVQCIIEKVFRNWNFPFYNFSFLDMIILEDDVNGDTLVDFQVLFEDPENERLCQMFKKLKGDYALFKNVENFGPKLIVNNFILNLVSALNIPVADYVFSEFGYVEMAENVRDYGIEISLQFVEVNETTIFGTEITSIDPINLPENLLELKDTTLMI
jgi:hypothetical protein